MPPVTSVLPKSDLERSWCSAIPCASAAAPSGLGRALFEFLFFFPLPPHLLFVLHAVHLPHPLLLSTCSNGAHAVSDAVFWSALRWCSGVLWPRSFSSSFRASLLSPPARVLIKHPHHPPLSMIRRPSANARRGCSSSGLDSKTVAAAPSKRLAGTSELPESVSGRSRRRPSGS